MHIGTVTHMFQRIVPVVPRASSDKDSVCIPISNLVSIGVLRQRIGIASVKVPRTLQRGVVTAERCLEWSPRRTQLIPGKQRPHARDSVYFGATEHLNIYRTTHYQAGEFTSVPRTFHGIHLAKMQLRSAALAFECIGSDLHPSVLDDVHNF